MLEGTCFVEWSGHVSSSGGACFVEWRGVASSGGAWEGHNYLRGMSRHSVVHARRDKDTEEEFHYIIEIYNLVVL